MTCSHCGMPGHVRADCTWAKESGLELERERIRRENKKPTDPDAANSTSPR